MAQAALFLGVHMTTVKRYLNNSKPYNGYIITKVNSGSPISVPTNVRQPILLTNPTTGIIKQFSTTKDACDYLEISSKRLSNYFKSIESSSDKQISTIKGYIKNKVVNDLNYLKLKIHPLRGKFVIYHSLPIKLGLSHSLFYKYSVRNLTTLISKNMKLYPYWVTGFTDAEGCFSINITNNPNLKTGWRVKATYQIGLHEKDRMVLELIQKFFGVGNITPQGKDCTI